MSLNKRNLIDNPSKNRPSSRYREEGFSQNIDNSNIISFPVEAVNRTSNRQPSKEKTSNTRKNIYNSDVSINNNNVYSKLSDYENNNYMKLLEEKVRNQAERLCNLENYKTLCERRILQLNPNESFPITEKIIEENHLFHKISFNNFQPSGDKQTNSNSQNFNEIYEENNMLKIKVANLEMENKYIRNIEFKNESKDFYLNDVADSIESEIVSLDKIPNENIREAYINLQNYCKKIKKEKDVVLMSLNKEIIHSEEQRNYIEILKSQVENSIINEGLVELLQKQKNFLFPKNKTMIEFICEISNLQNELKKKLIEISDLNLKIMENEKEKESLKQTSSENEAKREKIVENLKIGMTELEAAKVHVKSLETEKLDLENKCNNLNNDLQIIKKEKEDLLEIEKDLRKIIIDKESQIEALTKLVDQQSLLEDKIFEYKDRFEKQNEEIENIILDRKKHEQHIDSLNKKQENYEKQIKEKETLIKILDDKIKYFQNLHEESNSKLIKTETLLEDKEKEHKANLSNFKQSIEDMLIKQDFINKELIETNKTLEAKVREKEELLFENLNLKKENDSNMISISNFERRMKSYIDNEEKLLDELKIINKENIKLKQNLNEACLEIEHYKKENDSLKLEKDKYVILYDREKKDTINKDKLLKNKIGNFTLLNLKSAFKNLLNIFDKYFNKLALLKKNNFPCDDVKKERENQFNDFNFRKYVNKEYDSNISRDLLNDNKKKSERTIINVLDANIGFEKEPTLEINNSENLKDILSCIENFGDWISIIKEEINHIMKTFDQHESLAEGSIKSQQKHLRDEEDEQVDIYSNKINYSNRLNLVTKDKSDDVKPLFEDINKLQALNTELKIKNEKILREMKSFRNDNKKLYDQNKLLNKKFSGKMITIEKENLYLKNFIIKITNILTSVNVKKMVQQILVLNDNVIQLETEKINHERSLEKAENELKLYIEKNINNFDNSQAYKELNSIVDTARTSVSNTNREIQNLKNELYTLENKLIKEKQASASDGNNPHKIESKERIINEYFKNKQKESLHNDDMTDVDYSKKYKQDEVDSSTIEYTNVSPGYNISGNTESDIYMKHKTTNVFKKNYIDSSDCKSKFNSFDNIQKNKELKNLNFDYNSKYSENKTNPVIEERRLSRENKESKTDLKIPEKYKDYKVSLNSKSEFYDSDNLEINYKMKTKDHLRRNDDSDMSSDDFHLNEKYDYRLTNELKSKKDYIDEKFSSQENFDNIDNKIINKPSSENKHLAKLKSEKNIPHNFNDSDQSGTSKMKVNNRSLENKNKKKLNLNLTEDVDKFINSPVKLMSKNSENYKQSNTTTNEHFNDQNNFTFNNQETENSKEIKIKPEFYESEEKRYNDLFNSNDFKYRKK